LTEKDNDWRPVFAKLNFFLRLKQMLKCLLTKREKNGSKNGSLLTQMEWQIKNSGGISYDTLRSVLDFGK